MHPSTCYLISLVLSLLTFTTHGQPADSVVHQQTPLEILIESYDLSEDMSVASSGNDELILVAYREQAGQLNAPVFTHRVTLDQQKRTDTAQVSVPNREDLLLFLLEQDSNRKLTAIEPILRIYAKEIAEAHYQMDYKTIDKYLGDDDILGVKSYHWSEPTTVIELKGRHKLDKYHYQLTITASFP